MKIQKLEGEIIVTSSGEVRLLDGRYARQIPIIKSGMYNCKIAAYKCTEGEYDYDQYNYFNATDGVATPSYVSYTITTSDKIVNMLKEYAGKYCFLKIER